MNLSVDDEVMQQFKAKGTVAVKNNIGIAF
jgi:hypothetical protein